MQNDDKRKYPLHPFKYRPRDYTPPRHRSLLFQSEPDAPIAPVTRARPRLVLVWSNPKLC